MEQHAFQSKPRHVTPQIDHLGKMSPVLMNPPGQSSIEALHTVTLSIYISERDEPPGQSITEALHTTTLLIYIYIYRKEMNPPGQSSIEALHTNSLHIYIYIYIYIYYIYIYI